MKILFYDIDMIDDIDFYKIFSNYILNEDYNIGVSEIYNTIKVVDSFNIDNFKESINNFKNIKKDYNFSNVYVTVTYLSDVLSVDEYHLRI